MANVTMATPPNWTGVPTQGGTLVRDVRNMPVQKSVLLRLGHQWHPGVALPWTVLHTATRVLPPFLLRVRR